MTLDRNRISVSAGDMAYADAGDGPAVVLLHGFPTSADLWRDLVPMLAPRSRAIAPDLIGYGISSKPEDPGAMTIRAQAGHVRELLERLGVDRFAAVGHDVGGGVAQLLALEPGVEALVLVDSIAFDAWPIEAVKMVQAVDDEQVDQGFARRIVEMALEMGMARPERLSAADRETYVRPWLGDPLAVVRAARGIDGVGLADADERLAALDTRVLVLWGEDDPYLPADLAERLGGVMPGATTALVPGCSHYVTEDAPEAVLPLIAQYLGTHYLGERHAHPAPTPVELGISFERPAGPSDPEEG